MADPKFPANLWSYFAAHMRTGFCLQNTVANRCCFDPFSQLSRGFWGLSSRRTGSAGFAQFRFWDTHRLLRFPLSILSPRSRRCFLRRLLNPTPIIILLFRTSDWYPKVASIISSIHAGFHCIPKFPHHVALFTLLVKLLGIFAALNTPYPIEGEIPQIQGF